MHRRSSRAARRDRSRRGAEQLVVSVGALALLLGSANVLGQPTTDRKGAAQAEATTEPLSLHPADDIDPQIVERLQTVFGVVDELSKVEVSARAGVVHLHGEVLSEADRRHAAEIAARLEGVAYVDNDIEISSEVEDRVEPLTGILVDRFNAFTRRLPLLGFAFALFVPFALLARVLGRWHAPFRWVTRSELVRGIVQRIVATAVFLGGILVALEVLDATALVGAVLGAAGVVGIAVGFAFRDIAENYLASIILGMRRPFAVHDHVRIEEFEGRVVRLTTRETILMTFEGNHLRIPNATVFKAVILNYTRNPLRQYDFVVGAGVDEDLKAAQRLGEETLAAMPGTLQDPAPHSRIEELGESNVVIRFFGWIDQRKTDIFKARGEAIRRVKVALDDAGVDMPEPTIRIRRAPTKAIHAPASTHLVETDAAEVEVDDQLGRQIEQDLAEDTQGNLLRRS